MERRWIHRCLIALLASATGLSCSPPGAASGMEGPSAEARLNQWVMEHQQRPNALRALLMEMPKGADLHSHLSGAVYAEEYLTLAAEQGYCFNRRALTLIPPAQCTDAGSTVPARELNQHPDLYNAVLDQWSTRDVGAGMATGHADFFGAFHGFSALSSRSDLQGRMVASVANRAARQSIHYLELMLTLDAEPVRRLGRNLGWTGDADALRRQLLQQGLDEHVQRGLQQLALIDRDRQAALQCLGSEPQPGCKVEVRYLQQTNRTQSPAEVFAQLLYAFELAHRSDRVVGLNLVGPEDHPVARRDYRLQMGMLAALRKHYPDVGIALHAGELTRNLATPAELSFHIREAISVGGARRIGHGVSISYESNARQLLQLMAARQVLAELCLTSNAVILGVERNDHPLVEYQQAGVPIALASDDEGVLRTDLTEQFVLAVRRYGLNYSQLKQLARNSLSHSFLPGQSLWASTDQPRLNPACNAHDLSSGSSRARCRSLLKSSAKARLQWALESDFRQFERQPLMPVTSNGSRPAPPPHR